MENNQPDPKDSIEKKEVIVPEVPNLDVPKEGNPDDVRMEEDITENVADNGTPDESKNSDAEIEKKESIPEVTA